jgi:alkanesulfonate monooxygenase SsuD/methylene tetrahydromethanopterin reductase-like flavin-dependent oxidoreductase (luciferase family)
MRFDASMFWHHYRAVPWHQQVDQSRTWCKALEGLGFTAAWSSEHHFGASTSGSPPNALITALDVLNHTTTLRVGGAPYQVLDRHPLMVAEDAALVDNMSKGRLEFGAGRGFNENWGTQFVPIAHRRNPEQNRALLEEVLDIVIKAWTEDLLVYNGRFYTIPRPGWKEPSPNPEKHKPPQYNEEFEFVAVPVLPKPYQKPHPPIWLMGTSRDSFAYSGRKGFRMLGLARSPESALEHFEAYRDAASHAQHRDVPLGENIGLQFLVYCAPTMEQAQADSIHDQMNSPFIGTPESIGEQIERYRDVVGLKMFQLRPSVYGLTFSQAMASLQLFAEKVMPRFRDDGGWVDSSGGASGLKFGPSASNGHPSDQVPVEGTCR